MAKSRHLFRAFAAAIALPALLAGAAAIPAQAQISLSIGIGFDNFHNRLAPYGSWSNHPRWGQVWHPRAARDFRPYYYGHWVNTREYGWMWVSDESWGDITYHYGRWVYDPDEGWLWVPGYVWGPSWVVWRSGGGNIGWFPMPPGDDYYGDGAYRGNFDDEYGYRDWYGPSFGNVQFLALWTFVGESHFGDRNFRNYAVPQRDYGRFIGQTRDSTNYTTVNNYVVNRSVDANRLQQATRQRFTPVPARSVIRDAALVTPATTGRQIEQRERQQHPIPAAQAVPGRGAGQPAPQAPRAVAPTAVAPNANQVPQGPQGRGNLRNPAAAGTAQPVPQAERRAPGTATPNITQAPRVAPSAPVTQPTPANPPQDRGGRGTQQIERAAPQAPRVAPSAPVTQPAPANPPQDRSGRGTQQIERAAPQAPRVAPVAPVTQPTPANPPQDRSGRANQQIERAAPQAPRVAPAAPAAQPTPPVNPARDRSGRGNQQPDRGAAAQAPARVQANAPPAQDRGAQRGNRQNDNAGDQKAAGDKKDSGGRGPN